ncbi:MAG: CDP-alcohol phosphatidyltransferase family protein [Pseudomonadota bacterium]
MKDLYTIPNIISVSRLALAIPTIWLLLRGDGPAMIFAIVLLNYLELTDATDGYIARKWNQVSEVGKLLDPMFDSLCRFTIFATLLAAGILPLWMLLIFFYRDMSVSYYRAFAAQRQVTMSARVSGKVKAVVQGVGVILVCIILLSEQQRLHPEALSDTFFYGVIIGGNVLLVLFLAAFRIWGPVVATISAVGGGSTLLMVLLRVTGWAVPQADWVIWGLLFSVTMVTLWSFIDYTLGFLDVLRKR